MFENLCCSIKIAALHTPTDTYLPPCIMSIVVDNFLHIIPQHKTSVNCLSSYFYPSVERKVDSFLRKENKGKTFII